MNGGAMSADPPALRRGLYRGKVTIVALVLLLLGGILLLWVASRGEQHIWLDLLRDFGIAALISAILGTAYEYLLRHDYEGSMRDNLRALLETEEILRERYETRLESFKKAGVIRMYPKLTGELLEAKFSDAMQGKLEIKILQTWTGIEEGDIMSRIREALNAGCTIRILLLNPESTQVRYRAHSLNMEESDFRGRIISNLRALNAMNETAPGAGTITVKVYDALPAFHVFDFGTTKLMAPYWRMKTSTQGPQFEIAEVSTLGGIINKHFNDLWNDERPMDGQQLTKDASEVLNEDRRAPTN
jgi:hypothetical protein